MKCLALLDMVKKEAIEESFKKIFPGDKIDFIKWELPEEIKDFFEVILKLETEGPESVRLNNDVYAKIENFHPDIIVTHFTPINKRIIEKLSDNLKVIGVMRGGIENISLENATKHQIPVLNAPGRNANAVAEFTVALMLSEYKNIGRGHSALKNGRWRRRYPTGDSAHEIEGKVIGLIGFGKVGQLVAKKLINGFGCEVIAYDPFIDENTFNQNNIKKCTLEEVLKESDIVSIHARLSKETEDLINERELSLMKPTSYLINTARAGLVNREALYQALMKHKIAGAGLDVFWEEPLNINDEYLYLDNLTMTPHYAGSTVEAMSKSPLILFERIRKYLSTKDDSMPLNKI